MKELDARAFRGHRRSLDGGRNPACEERVLSDTKRPAGSGVRLAVLLLKAHDCNFVASRWLDATACKRRLLVPGQIQSVSAIATAPYLANSGDMRAGHKRVFGRELRKQPLTRANSLFRVYVEAYAPVRIAQLQ
jgi:hypothetical protein